MSVNDEIIMSSSDSFWEVDCYRRTTKRHEDGHKLCSDLMSLINERAAIEKNYAKELKAWTHKWNMHIEKGPEYGTMEAGWRSVLSEADDVAELHLTVKDKLLNNVHTEMKQWQTENYHKKMVGHSKETKELDEEFRKAQKPWAKRYSKVVKTKKEYHNACKLEKSATNQESNARADSSVSQDQMKKLQDKVDKCQRDVLTTREKYEASLNDITSYNAKYMEDMTDVFQKAQEYEEKRLLFFKEILYGIRKSLCLSDTPAYADIYGRIERSIGVCDANKDLRWWSQNHGVDMAMYWPTMEEYSPDLHSISRKKPAGVGGDGIMLTSIRGGEHPQEQPPAGTQSYDNHSMTNSNHGNSRPPSCDYEINKSSGTDAPPPLSSNPFGDDSDQDQEDARPKINNGGPAVDPPSMPDNDQWEDDTAGIDESSGVAVRAMYDYIGQEEDELSFKAGDVFVKLLDADDQGWCTGKKNGKVGLYPNNYVENVD